MAVGFHKFSVRYDYTIRDGFVTHKDGSRHQKYKTRTATRTVECENANPTENELAAILMDSHRREEPTELKIAAFRPVQTEAAAKSQALDVASAQEVRIAALEAEVAELKTKVATFDKALNDYLLKQLEANSDKSAEKPKSGK